MFAFDWDFYPRPESRGGELWQFDEALSSFLSEMWRNGNVVGEWHLLELEGRVQARVQAPEEGSLDSANFSPNGLADAATLRELCVREPEVRLVPEVPRLDTWCRCAEPSGYVLFTQARGHTADSPVECWDCGRPVPLYKIPRVGSHEQERAAHYAIRRWEFVYRALDMLFLQSGIGERFAYRHLSSPRSELMRDSRRLARMLEGASGKPFYAFLQQWHENPAWSDACPLCGLSWELDEMWNGKYGFRCERSRIVAEEAYQDPTPLGELHP